MKHKDNVKIVIAESAPILRTGLTGILKRFSRENFSVTEIANGEALPMFLRLHMPHVLIINPMFQPAQNAAALKKEYPDLRVIAYVSSMIDPKALSDYDAMISIHDEPDDINDKLSTLLFEPEADDDTQDTEQLSSREKGIICYVVKGLTNKSIADALSISIHTVITHRRNIAKKLQIHSSAGLAIYAIANRLVDLKDIKDNIN